MKILVVDDEKLLVKGIKFNLENDGYTVVTGADGMDAVDRAAAGRYRPDRARPYDAAHGRSRGLYENPGVFGRSRSC
ncbi:MAG: hypothetical protein V8T01_11300 [Oscillospiraceae bacterium]